MTTDRSKEAEQAEDASQRDPRKIEMTTEFDPALRTDKRILGSVLVIVLSFLAVLGYPSGDYSLMVTGGLLLLAFGILLLLLPYNALREAW